nr:MAG TPA: hypothetical protein [Caudoviricetes sp.]
MAWPAPSLAKRYSRYNAGRTRKRRRVRFSLKVCFAAYCSGFGTRYW